MQRGAFQSLAFRAKVSAARGSLVDDAAAAELRTTEQPIKEVAVRLRISLSYAYAIRAGRNRLDYRQPFAALVALAQ